MSPYRAEWPKEQFIPPYVPRFRSGWEPPMLNFMGAPMEQDMYQLAESVANAAEHQRKQDSKRMSTEVRIHGVWFLWVVDGHRESSLTEGCSGTNAWMLPSPLAVLHPPNSFLCWWWLLGASLTRSPSWATLRQSVPQSSWSRFCQGLAHKRCLFSLSLPFPALDPPGSSWA